MDKYQVRFRIAERLDKTPMMKPNLFDVVELLVDLPELGLQVGDRGAIVEEYSDRAYEIEFTNPEGETLVLHTLSPEQFIVVWVAKC